MLNRQSATGASAEVVRLDGAGRIYGVATTACVEGLSWAIFTGRDAGRQAYAYADAHFSDVKTGRSVANAAEILGFAC